MKQKREFSNGGKMKTLKITFITLLLLVFLDPLSYLNAADSGETFALEGIRNIRFSIEHYKKKAGFTPLVFSMGDLDLNFVMDSQGDVWERKEKRGRTRYGRPLFSIDSKTPGIVIAGDIHYCTLSSRNPVRSRMKLPARNIPLKMVVKPMNRGVDIHLGQNKLELRHLSVKYETNKRGLLELRFRGIVTGSFANFAVDKEKRVIRLHRTAGRATLAGQPNPTAALRQTRAIGATILPAAERQALIALYNSTGGPNWRDNTNWLGPEGSEGTWYGVTVNGEGHVEGIDLFFNDLCGVLPGELGDLPELISLDLSSNNIEAVPAELGNLAGLETLALIGNDIVGSIPPEFGNLSNLKTLILDYNRFSGSIPGELGNLSNLEMLMLNNNQLSGSIPPELGNLSALQFFEGKENLLSGSLPAELGNLTALKSLYLQGNEIPGALPPELGNLSNLSVLHLYENRLTGNIPPELGNLTSLELLRLNDNLLTGPIPGQLGNLVNLENLSLHNNLLSGAVPGELGSLSVLRYLRLQDNGLSGSLPAALGNLSSLRWFMLSNNELSGSIPAEFGSLTEIVTLCLDHNQFSGPIPAGLGNMAWMEQCDLSHNQFAGNIPGEIGNWKNPWYINFSANKLTGEIPGGLIYHEVVFHLFDVNINYNGLYTNDSFMDQLLNCYNPGWNETQTAAVPDVSAEVLSGGSIRVNWTPISYTADGGGYRLFYAAAAGGPYTYFGTTADKTASSMTITGLTPGTPYYFVVQTRTEPHAGNGTTVDSEYSEEVTDTAAAITVTSPNGGDTWVTGAARDITWTAAGLCNNIHIVLQQNGVNKALIAKNINPASGSYSWTVGDCIKGKVTPGENYQLLIVERDSKVKDKSDSYFSIAEPGITVISPDGGESWTIGGTENITWTNYGYSGNIHIILLRNGVKVALIAKNIDAAPGTFAWTVGDCIKGSVTPGTGYQVLIVTTDFSMRDSSDASFSLIN